MVCLHGIKMQAAQHAMLPNAGRAVMHLNQKIAQGEQEGAQLERAFLDQAKRSQALEAELAAANRRTKQLEVRLHF